MKTNKEDIRLLKSKHRLELVMQEAGESFEVDAEHSNQWRSKLTTGLTVDIHRQMYEFSRPGMDTETGDVIAWLRRRYAWDFGKAIKFLQNRTPDPKQETHPAKVVVKSQRIRNDELEEKPLDQWQERALKIGGERMRNYFPWSWLSLAMYMPETRIEPTHAPEITTCPQCGNRIDWYFEKTERLVRVSGNTCFEHEHIGPIPVLAYSIKRKIDISYLGMEGSQELKEFFDEAKLSEALQKKITRAIAGQFDGLLEVAGALFVEEEDGVVCAKCAWLEYDFQIALALCKTSARCREKEKYEEERKRDHESRIEAAREREILESKGYVFGGLGQILYEPPNAAELSP